MNLRIKNPYLLRTCLKLREESWFGAEFFLSFVGIFIKSCLYYLVYRAVFLVMIVVGGAGDMSAVWQMADIFNGLMALPNLTAILLLSPEALSLWRTWVGKRTGKQALSCIARRKSLY